MSRHWLVLPNLFPHTVVYFFYKNDRRAPGRSWTIRDYSTVPVQEYDPDDFDLTHDELLAQATLDLPAPRKPVDDPYWPEETARLNNLYRHLLRPREGDPAVAAAVPPPPGPNGHDAIPILDELELRQQRRGLALTRILTSRNSEDWVSWTVFRMLPRIPGWWPAFLQIAQLDLDENDVPPTVGFWRRVPSPAPYEAALRARMLENPAHQARAANARPVEAPTEVEIALDGQSFLIFIEAKLYSDLSPCTTYDPTRNQLARNIDVLLGTVGRRRAIMMMVVLDRAPDRLYSTLVDLYRGNPSALHSLLPHRTRAEIESVAGDLRLILWADLEPLIRPPCPPDVLAELRRRIGLGPNP